ncbi:hypothetical protein HMN09_00170200 [Mycena chlorophos]|uniref:Uncharacterized protein n=1 Tax=Mycena chlorophos TaxID=658473 RepID=A0A8H6WKK0_MYCCL|nr:hypothetical protein HMN09_00170200 [Mycena chlorophos]
MTTAIKSRRRQGLSQLQVPPLHSEWRLTMSMDDEGVEIFDFPRPPSHRPQQHSSSDESCSSDDHASPVSSPPTTPATSPITPTHPRPLARCKTIKPLTITKRAVSPRPQLETVEDAEAEDDVFYASDARNYMTLSPPLPASFPRTIQRSPSPKPEPTCPLPPVPSSSSRPTHSRTPSNSSSQFGSPPNYSRPISFSAAGSRPPLRSDAHPYARESGDFHCYSVYAPLIESTPPIDSLEEIPSEDDEALSLSPIITTRNPDLEVDSDLDLELDQSQEEEKEEGEKPLPLPPYTGWHPRPQVRASELRGLGFVLPRTPTPSPTPSPATPPLRSRWSTSTLSSVRDLPSTSSETSPFNARAFAKRYFSAPRVVRASPGKEKEPKDMPAATNKSPKGKGKGKLTVSDVRVLLSPPPSTAASAPLPITSSTSSYFNYSSQSQSDSGCFSSSLPRSSTESRETFIMPAARSEIGHSHSRTSSGESGMSFDADDDADEDDEDIVGLGLRSRRRRRKPIPAFLGMHAR